MNAKTWFVLGACLGAIAVVTGLIHAHGLEKYLVAMNVSGAELHKRMRQWETGARYEMYCALALFAAAWLASRTNTALVHAAGLLLFLGGLIFSVSLYALALSGVKPLGMIVPIGGLLMLLGWLSLAGAGWGLEDAVAPLLGESQPKDGLH